VSDSLFFANSYSTTTMWSSIAPSSWPSMDLSRPILILPHSCKGVARERSGQPILPTSERRPTVGMCLETDPHSTATGLSLARFFLPLLQPMFGMAGYPAIRQ
jgi:hypothetical protein